MNIPFPNDSNSSVGWDLLLELGNLTLPYCSDSIRYPRSQVILRLFFIAPIAVMGLTGNAININIFMRKVMLSSLNNWFFLGLSISDCMVLINSLLMIVLPVVTEGSQFLFIDRIVNYCTRWAYPMANLSQMLSVYFVVMVTSHRYLGICHPFFARTRCTTGTVKAALFAIVSFCVFFTSIRWFFVEIAPCYSEVYGVESIQVVLRWDLSNNWILGFGYQVVLYIIVMFLIPFTTLCLLNYKLIKAIQKSSANRNYGSFSTRRRNIKRPKIPASIPALRNRFLTPRHSRPKVQFSPIHILLNHNSQNRRKSSEKSEGRQQLTSKVISNFMTLDETDDGVTDILLPESTPGRSRGESSSNRLGSQSEQTSDFTGKHLRVEPDNRRSSCNSNNGQRKNERARREAHRDQNITKMTVIIVCLFLLCNLLPFVNNAMEILGLIFQSPLIQRDTFIICVDVGNLLVVANSSLYILIYLNFNSKYLKTFYSIFCHRHRRGGRGGRGGPASGSEIMTQTINLNSNIQVERPVRPNLKNSSRELQQRRNRSSSCSPGNLLVPEEEDQFGSPDFDVGSERRTRSNTIEVEEISSQLRSTTENVYD